MPATSFFTYPVTRKYPAKFTWIILAGGAILITFFTFVAVAGNAYQLETYYTNDYNATIANKTWYQRQAFSWATDLETTCQPTLLTIGGDHTTTNQGFHYAIGSFHHEGNSSNIPLTASYRNGSLNNCEVREIVIELVRKDENRLPRNFWSWGSTYARSTTECTMATDDGPLKVNFTSELPTALRRREITDAFLSLNDTAHPGRYIGAQILGSWYIQISVAMGYSAPGELDDVNAASWGSGTVTLTRSDVTDYKSLDFFYCDTGFNDDGGGLSWMHPPNTIQHWYDQWTPEAAQNNYDASMPNISLVVDAFAKTYYSLLLSDFNTTEETKATNALSTSEGIEYLQTVNDTDLANVRSIFGDKGGGAIGRSTNNLTNLNQPLDFAQHTTLFSRYLCSIPKQKSTFKLLFAVVLADIVFLNACWTVFGWIATWWLGRTDPHAEHCIGCVNATHDIPLTLAAGSLGGGSYSQLSSDTADNHGGDQGRLSAPQVARDHSGV
jgi:hypothetical protein